MRERMRARGQREEKGKGKESPECVSEISIVQAKAC